MSIFFRKFVGLGSPGFQAPPPKKKKNAHNSRPQNCWHPSPTSHFETQISLMPIFCFRGRRSNSIGLTKVRNGQILAVRILAAKLPNSDFEFCCGFWVDFLLIFFSKEKGPEKIHQKIPPQKSPGNLFGKIPLGFLQNPSLEKVRNETSAQRGSFGPDIPTDIRSRTSVRPSKFWKKTS